MGQANLLITQGADTGLRVQLASDVTIGRAFRNDLRLNDAEVSRHHAEIAVSPEGCILRDNNSANGTFVNRRQVEIHRLETGDQIQIGRTVLIFDGGVHRKPDAAPVKLVDTGTDDRSQIVHQIGHDDTQTYVRPEVIPAEDVSPARLSGLQVLYRVSDQAASAALSQEQMLQQILDLAVKAVGGDRGCVMLCDASTNKLTPTVFSATDGDPEQMIISRTIVDYVAGEQTGVCTSDAQADARFDTGHSIVASGIREAICVPMMGMSDLIGVIYVDSVTGMDEIVEQTIEREESLDDQLKLILAIGRQAAIAVERRRYQQALLKAERFAAVGQTITMLGHHIKNILQGVRGGSFLIETGLDHSNEEMLRQGWEIVDRNQDRIYNLVMDMLTYSTERKPALIPGCINDVVAEVCSLMKARAASCEVGFEFEAYDQLPASSFDAHGIHRAVLNIVTNAIDAVEGLADARVTVSTGYIQGSSTLSVSVTDNGPGIPADQKETLFSLFESSKGARGTGLGLAVSRKIMTEHGGRIEVESAEGSGTVFRLILPLIDQQPSVQDRPTDVV